MSAYICNTEHFVAMGIFASKRIGGYGCARLSVDPRYIEGMEEYINATIPDAAMRGATHLNDYELATVYADILYQENIRSVLARYPSDDLQSAPGQSEKPEHIEVTAQDIASGAYRVKPIDILSMCNCLEYQSCETDDYRQSLAWRLMESIRASAIRQLPGYDKAIRDFCLPEAA